MSAALDELFVAVSRHEAMRRMGMASTPPQLNGRYQLHAVIGSGSFGVVYRAWDPVFDRWVALKRTRSADLGEARALAAIRHPNVVRVFDASLDGGTVTLVMEYLDGAKLADWVRAAEPGTTELVALLAKIADGLAAIHDAGLVHGDVKSSNIMVVTQEPVIIDLGLSMTRSGGTPKYAAPEVRDGQPPDAAADQYSFCLVSLELLDSRGGWSCGRCLRRGLADAKVDRWPSLAALAKRLHACAEWRRRWWLSWLLAFVVGLCGHVEDPRFASAWTDLARERDHAHEEQAERPSRRGDPSGSPGALPLRSATRL